MPTSYLDSQLAFDVPPILANIGFTTQRRHANLLVLRGHNFATAAAATGLSEDQVAEDYDNYINGFFARSLQKVHSRLIPSDASRTGSGANSRTIFRILMAFGPFRNS